MNKIMDYEKKYKEALERARQEYNTTENVGRKLWLEELFPELTESEDERTRKEIVEIFKSLGDCKIPSPINYADIFTWLEKQGEQKQEWSLQDEKNLDDIFCAIRLDNALSDEKQDRLICWLQQYRPYIHKEHKPAWSEEDETKIKCIIALLKEPAVCAMDGNKGIIEASIKYLESLKERVQPQQKPTEWSEDDDNMLEVILHTLGKIVRHKNFDGAVMSSCENAASWLKSLKQRIGE